MEVDQRFRIDLLNQSLVEGHGFIPLSLHGLDFGKEDESLVAVLVARIAEDARQGLVDRVDVAVEIVDLGQAVVSRIIVLVQVHCLEVVLQGIIILLSLVVYFAEDEVEVTPKQLDLPAKLGRGRVLRSLQLFALSNRANTECLSNIEVVAEQKVISQVLHRQRIRVI